MLNPKIQDAFNKQINAELYSSYLYLSMSAYFESRSLGGMANWMRVQAQEELTHAAKFFDFINDRGGRVELVGVDGPRTEWNSALEVLEETYEHECKVSALINELVDVAQSENDHAAETFLQWFITEQIEEEATAQTLVDKLKLAGDSGVGALLLDGELGQRTFVPPAVATA